MKLCDNKNTKGILFLILELKDYVKCMIHRIYYQSLLDAKQNCDLDACGILYDFEDKNDKIVSVLEKRSLCWSHGEIKSSTHGSRLYLNRKDELTL